MSTALALKGKIAVVTGGSHGIGFAIVQSLTTQGCQVVITGRDSARLDSAASKLGGLQAGVSAVGCDVSDSNQVERLFLEVKKTHSKIDILINNAGISHSPALVEKLSIDSWKSVIDTNLNGMFFCTRATLPLMQAGGTIVNNLSVAAVRSFPGLAAYNASKSGALGFTNVLREELRKRGIRVLALIVGATDTPIWDQFWPEAPREKMISAATVAEAVIHALTLPANSTIEEIRLGPTTGAL